jgi:hypothetical protein
MITSTWVRRKCGWDAVAVWLCGVRLALCSVRRVGPVGLRNCGHVGFLYGLERIPLSDSLSDPPLLIPTIFVWRLGIKGIKEMSVSVRK